MKRIVAGSVAKCFIEQGREGIGAIKGMLRLIWENDAGVNICLGGR
jgi:hypothetical protein